ncbi:putative transporter svop-1 [Pseudolycoriella hygida]|uniref:Transporter svop-1 n=1 Tax=Pseudolycoriella hygida TaxID=35572 RepID=A0A9Q0N5F8_9DIPT|nr:putative transporter svop-1 [Pseudolycoriella hygida]
MMVFTVEEIFQKPNKEANVASFEDALNETRFGKFHYCLIFISGIFMTSVFWEVMGINYVLPVAECDLNITSKQQYGIVSGVWFLGIIVTSNLWGFVSDTYGRRNVLIISTLAALLTSVCSSLSANLWQLVLFRLLNGILLEKMSINGDEARTIKIFQTMYYINTGKKDYRIVKIKPNEEFSEKHEQRHVTKMMLDQLIELFRDYPRSISLVSTIQFCMYFVCNGMLLFFPDIVNERAMYLQTSSSSDVTLCEIVQHANRATANASNVVDQTRICVDELDISAFYYALILEGCYTGGFFLLSVLVNYVGRLAIFTFVSFSTGICGFLIVWIQNATVALYLYVWLLGSGVTVILLNTVTYDLFPTHLRALALGVSTMFGRLASLMGGNIAGLMLERHCSAMYILSGSISISAGILIFFIPNIRQKKY